MFINVKLAAVLNLLAVLPQSVDGYASYVAKIPNGNNIPNPCSRGSKWPGVGHVIPAGDGSLNQFGVDYKNEGSWTQALCRKDSDGDGKTNGEELGDPNCAWKEGQSDPTGSVVTNPAVCEPVGSAACSQRCESVMSVGGDAGSSESSEANEGGNVESNSEETVTNEVEGGSSPAPAVIVPTIISTSQSPTPAGVETSAPPGGGGSTTTVPTSNGNVQATSGQRTTQANNGAGSISGWAYISLLVIVQLLQVAT